ncbi:inositol monophosphatase family protein [Terricaulis sp.]|uniref:inositol monophosphatase family protein n=1 Tax=Terricaulis sp. TaxID=2768686 RepID=UPI00378369C9
MAEPDLKLLEAALREAGVLVRALRAKPLEVTSKGAAGPVTNIDFAVNELLAERLRSARPDYGWLSEESPDAPDTRMSKARTFMLDPIDGTQAMIDGAADFAISLGVVHGATAHAGAIYLPMTDEMFLGAAGEGATLNGAAIRASTRAELEGAHIIGKRGFYKQIPWRTPWPETAFTAVQAIATRLAYIAAGRFDATILYGPKNEWDIAAGAAIIAAAGGRFTDARGAPIVFNNRTPKAPGAVAAGAQIHPLIIDRTKHFPHRIPD